MSICAVETDAGFAAAQSVAIELGIVDNPNRTGRLGLQFDLGDPAEAYRLTVALRQAGHEAWVTADVGPALRQYRESREQIKDVVRLAAETGLTQVGIANLSGLSRQWVARIIAGDDPSA